MLLSALEKLNIESKEDIWVSLKSVEKRIYKSLKDELKNLENNSGLYQIENFVKNDNNANNTSNSEGFESVPNINFLMNINNYFCNKLKMAKNNVNENINMAKEYKFFISNLVNKRNFKYSYLKVNPIYDFFSFGFIEILRLVKFKSIIHYNPANPDFEKIYQDLLKKICEKKR